MGQGTLCGKKYKRKKVWIFVKKKSCHRAIATAVMYLRSFNSFFFFPLSNLDAVRNRQYKELCERYFPS